jgi:peptidyl-tRNA hydrolase, PTH1 family
MQGIQLIVGLGNPGDKYTHTRHNAGFWWIDQIAPSQMNLDAKFYGHATKLSSGVWLLKPNTFMNLSGKAVAAICNFYKIASEHVLIVHDELDLPAGSAKLKKGGGHGGHNGLKDIEAALGTKDFWRLRLGIDHPGDRNEVVNYVLNAPSKSELALINQSIDDSLRILPELIAGQFEQAMLKLHTKQA